MKISDVDADATSYSAVIQDGANTRRLRFEFGRELENGLSSRADAALVTLLMPAMAAGTALEIDGRVSADLMEGLGQLQKILVGINPRLNLITVDAAETVSGEVPSRGCATGLSGGIDSFCVLADHRPKLTHLLFNNIWSYKSDAGPTFNQRYGKAQALADRIGLPLVSVNFNLEEFYQGFTFQETHTMRNASVALALQPSIGRFLYASSYPMSEIGIRPTYDIAYVDPIILPLLGTDQIRLSSVGGEYTRVEKTLKVAEYPLSYDTLDICVYDDGIDNCSECWKCQRTELTLEIAGLLDRYASVFDIEKYRRAKLYYLSDALRSHDPLVKEVLDFAAERGFPIPLSARLRSTAIGRAVVSLLPRSLTRAVRKALVSGRTPSKGPRVKF